MSLIRAREFLLGGYHDLPNVLFMGSLILGSISGYLPLVWVSLGLVGNGAVIALFQTVAGLLFDKWDQISVSGTGTACSILGRAAPFLPNDGITVVTPSHWFAAATFFSTFTIINSIKVAIRKPAAGAPSSMIDLRRAFSLSTIVVGLVFFALMLGRGFSGCETWLGGISAIVISGLLAWGYWELLDSCGAGTIPDVTQVVNAMAPAGANQHVPVICTPPKNP
jgi:hypothetical protein